MAVTFNEAAQVARTANGGYTVLPENVVLKPELNGRFEETSVDELAEDIKHRGQLIAAICYKDNDGWPVLVAGHRRLRAITLLNKDITDPDKKYRLKFNYQQINSEEEALDLTVAENRNRTDVNPLDDAANIAIYIVKFGRGIEEIAKKYFPGTDTPEKLEKAVKWVQDRQKLLELSTEAQEAFRAGYMSTSAALQLADIPSRDKQTAIVNDAKAEGKDKLKVRDVKEAKDSVATTEPKPRKEIRDNTPVKLLEKYKKFAEVSGGLASEVLAKRFHRNPDKDVLLELSEQVLVMCKKLGVVLEASSDKWAEDNMDVLTVIDD